MLLSIEKRVDRYRVLVLSIVRPCRVRCEMQYVVMVACFSFGSALCHGLVALSWVQFPAVACVYIIMGGMNVTRPLLSCSVFIYICNALLYFVCVAVGACCLVPARRVYCT